MATYDVIAKTYTINEINEKCGSALDDFDYGRLKSLSSAMLIQSKTAKDKGSEGMACFYLGTAELFLGNANAARPLLERAQELGQKQGIDSILAYTFNVRGIYEASVNNNLYLAQYFFMKSLEYGKDTSLAKRKNGGGVYANLAQIALMQKDTLGMVYARNCYDYGCKSGSSHSMSQGALLLANFYYMKNMNDSALVYLKVADNIYQKNGFKDIGSVYILYSQVLASKKKINEAFRFVEMAIDEAMKNTHILLPKAYLQKAQLLYDCNRLDEALNSLVKAKEMAEKYSVFTEIIDIYELMAKVYHLTGNEALALKYLQYAKDSSETRSNNEREQLIRERGIILNMSQKEQEAMLHKSKLEEQMKLNVALMIGVLLLVVLLVLCFWFINRRNKLYKSIVAQNQKAIAREKELLLRIKMIEEKQTNPVHGTESKNNKKADELYGRLIDAMEHDRMYIDSQLSRDSLAEALDTNRTYLTNLIKERTGMSVPQFINSYRINEAIRILSDKSTADVPMKSLCFELGFNSQATFYRLFQTSVGMSPLAYRNSVMK